MELLNSSNSLRWVATTTNSNLIRTGSAGGTCRIVRVREERAPNMRTPTRKGISRGDLPGDLLPMTAGRALRGAGPAAMAALAGLAGLLLVVLQQTSNLANTTTH